MSKTKGATPEKTLHLVAAVKGGFRDIRELTPHETAVYLKAHGHLLDHDEAISLTEIVRRNLAAFEACVGDLSKMAPGPGLRGTLSREAKLEVNRHFLNFLAAFRQLLDHTETRIKREYAENSDVYRVFQKRTAAAFDGVFAYRFFYKLRNFSQHCGAPVGIVDYVSKLNDSGGVIETLHLFFDAQHLLRVGRDTWGVVKADLKKLESRFPVDPLPRKIMTELESIWEAVRQAEKPYLEESARIVLATVKDVLPPYITPAIVKYTPKKKATLMEFINPPVVTMAWLGDHTFKEIL
ncbi:hypothetical protein PS943_02710 [Pseudomonas fluorescens]|uniref:Uncharacterized protein n=1 Tax=Pseudomonas fluorescens TaxID=294 RepID=A0A5E7WBQ6_PSEFL|nr:hypothetical protein [Pseudomonas fluorescens]VVQ32137.1 hypothetical protein PS943_02710 [Pseudomonas fluorescens]